MKRNKSKLFKADDESLANSCNNLMYIGQKLNRIEIMSDEKKANYYYRRMMQRCFESKKQRKRAFFSQREKKLNPGQPVPNAMSDDKSDCKKLHNHTIKWVRRG